MRTPMFRAASKCPPPCFVSEATNDAPPFFAPRAFFHAALCGFFVLVLGATLMCAPRSAQAQYPGSVGYNPPTGSKYPNGPYTGGSVTVTGGGSTNTTAYANGTWGTAGLSSASGYGGSGYTYASTEGPGSVNCSGGITATFQWNGGSNNQPLPPGVLELESCNVAYDLEYSQYGSGSCTTSFGSSNETVVSSGPGYEQIMGYRYTYVSNPPATITINASPSASASASVQTGDCAVSASEAYTASVTPFYIDPVGATQDSSGGWDILIGQKCSPVVVGVPSGNGWSASYAWGVTGTTFQTWQNTTPALNGNPANPNASYYVGGPGPLNGPSPSGVTPVIPPPSWYWNDLSQTTETITCTVTLTPPPGQGKSFSATLSQPVTVMIPNVFGWSTVGGYMKILIGAANGADYLEAVPDVAHARGGMDFNALVTTPTSPAFGTGHLEMVQIAIPNRSYYDIADGTTHYDPENNQVGLDTQYPYGGIVDPEPTYQASDSPDLVLQNGTTPIASSAQMTDQFQDTLMYEPPNSGQYVPIGTFSWNIDGSASIPTTPTPESWASYPPGPQNTETPYAAGTVSPASGGFTPSNFFPSWGVIDKFPAF